MQQNWRPEGRWTRWRKEELRRTTSELSQTLELESLRCRPRPPSGMTLVRSRSRSRRGNPNMLERISGFSARIQPGQGTRGKEPAANGFGAFYAGAEGLEPVDDFGAFDEPAAASEAPTTASAPEETDDFGAFEDEPAVAEPEATDFGAGDAAQEEPSEPVEAAAEEKDATDDFGAFDAPQEPLQRHQSQRLRMTLELLMRPRRKRTTLVPLRMSGQLRSQAADDFGAFGMSLMLPQRPQPLPRRLMNPSLQRHQSQRLRMTLEHLMHHRSPLLQRRQSQRLRMTLELLVRPRRKRTTLVPLRMSRQLRSQRPRMISVPLGMSLMLPQRPQPLPWRQMTLVLLMPLQLRWRQTTLGTLGLGRSRASR